jgi:DNA-binding NtrC family response regulator
MFRVLIADPHARLAAEYRALLRLSGYAVETAGDGLECIARIRSFHPDLVVLEPDIPWGGGDGVLTVLGEEAILPDCSVVLISEGVKRKCVGAELVTGRYEKPLTPGDLLAIVRNVIEQREEREVWAPWSVVDTGES